MSVCEKTSPSDSITDSADGYKKSFPSPHSSETENGLAQLESIFCRNRTFKATADTVASSDDYQMMVNA